MSHYDENYGDYNGELMDVLTFEEEQRRKEKLALHLMNWGRFFAMQNEVLALDFKVPKMRIGQRKGIYTSLSLNNPNSFKGISAKSAKQHFEKHGWSVKETKNGWSATNPKNPSDVYKYVKVILTIAERLSNNI